MNPFEFVLIIIAMSFAYGLLRDYLKRRAKKAEKAAPEMLERLQVLEERIAVLERIVTDRNESLRREFDQLRHG
ncbi:MAG: hypothetical protein JJU27_15535 [Gammaproteobacteria bacterium]|nr:hypothetical protein [Gammaproteobacteria bacterium]